MPPADQVNDALDRVLASDVFARSGRARDLLRYIVEQDLAGHSDRLKGFSIGVDVFGKGEGFDPSTDPVVRVQVGRLREFLEQYYQGPGESDPLQIIIPRGNYVPEYRLVEFPVSSPAVPHLAVHADDPLPPANPEPVAEIAVGPGAGKRGVAGRVLASLGVGALAIFLAFTAYQVFWPRPLTSGEAVTSGAEKPVGPEVSASSLPHNQLPTVFIEVETQSPIFERVATLLRRGLAGFDTVSFIARHNGREEKSGMDFVFILDEGGSPGQVHLELQHMASGRVLLSTNVSVEGETPAAIEDRIADLLTSVVPVSGLIYTSLAENGLETPLTRCLVLNDDFYRNQTKQKHRAAYECFEALETQGLRSAIVHSELSSLHVQALSNNYDYPNEISAQHALRYAQEGVKLGPNSPYAHRAMGYVMSRNVNVDESIRWTKKAYELNTFDLGMAAAYGYALIFAGDYTLGTPVLRRAVEAASSHALWWDYGLFLGQFMLEDMTAAAKTVSALVSSKRAHYVAARLIVADAHDLRDEKQSLLAELQAGHSVFASDPEAFFRRGNYPPDLISRLVGALRGAGLLGAS